MKINLVGECFEMTDNTRIAELPQVPEAKGFDEVVCAALDHPLDLQPLAQWDLRGKRVAIMVDDWGRPTPCGDFLPSVLDRLNAAGAADDHITIVTASGMHDPHGRRPHDRQGRPRGLPARALHLSRRRKRIHAGLLRRHAHGHARLGQPLRRRGGFQDGLRPHLSPQHLWL